MNGYIFDVSEGTDFCFVTLNAIVSLETVSVIVFRLLGKSRGIVPEVTFSTLVAVAGVAEEDWVDEQV